MRPAFPLVLAAAVSLGFAAVALSAPNTPAPLPTPLTAPEGCPGNCVDPIPEHAVGPLDEGGFESICNTASHPHTVIVRFLAPGDRLCVGDTTLFPVKYWEIHWRTDHPIQTNGDFIGQPTFAVGGNEPPGSTVQSVKHVSGVLYLGFKSWGYGGQESEVQDFGVIVCN
jgi:hypothetical protein